MKATGLIYFVRQGQNGPVKIGWSTDVRKRLVHIQTYNPEKLQCLGVMEGSARDEHALHRRFRDHHIHGEWFRPAPELMEFIGHAKPFVAEIVTVGPQWISKEPLPFPRLLTPDEVAESLGLTRAQVIRQARIGVIPAVKVGKVYRFRPSAIASGGTRDAAAGRCHELRPQPTPTDQTNLTFRQPSKYCQTEHLSLYQMAARKLLIGLAI